MTKKKKPFGPEDAQKWLDTHKLACHQAYDLMQVTAWAAVALEKLVNNAYQRGNIISIDSKKRVHEPIPDWPLAEHKTFEEMGKELGDSIHLLNVLLGE